MIRTKSGAMLVCLIVFIPQILFATESAKFLTEDAPTVAAGDIELEFTYVFESSNKSFSDSNQLRGRAPADVHLFDFTATAGLSDVFDVSAAIGIADLSDTEESPEHLNGIGDLSFAAKYTFYRCAERHFVSFVPGLVIDAGSTRSALAVGQGYTSFDSLLVYTFVDNGVTFSTDTGFSLPIGERRDTARGTLVFDAGFGFHLHERFKPVVELGVTRDFVEAESDPYQVQWLLGFVSNVSDSFRIDVGLATVAYGRLVDRAHSAGINFSYTI